MFITVLADGTAFVSLIFAYFFFWTVHPDWPPPMAGEPDLAAARARLAAAVCWPAG